MSMGQIVPKCPGLVPLICHCEKPLCDAAICHLTCLGSDCRVANAPRNDNDQGVNDQGVNEQGVNEQGLLFSSYRESAPECAHIPKPFTNSMC
jgi:hypothetical protein